MKISHNATGVRDGVEVDLRRKCFTFGIGVGLVLASALAGAFDPYDVQKTGDNAFSTTRNELMHGSDQWHDLAALPDRGADEDWYRISQRPFSSYEVSVEGISGDILGKGFQVQRIANDGTTVLQDAARVGRFNRSLRFANLSNAAVNDELIVVRGAECGTACGPDDVYRIRASETTTSIARFNNSGSMVTVLLLQNPTDYAIEGTVYFWTAAGLAAGTSPLNLGAKSVHVLATQTVATSTAGSITIAHDGRYGDLTGKAVGLEAATGSSFDTAMEHRPR